MFASVKQFDSALNEFLIGILNGSEDWNEAISNLSELDRSDLIVYACENGLITGISYKWNLAKLFVEKHSIARITRKGLQFIESCRE